jgi:hypothetical protein
MQRSCRSPFSYNAGAMAAPAALPLVKEETGRIVVPQPFPIPARIFGALFMLPGLKLMRDVGAAMIEVNRAKAWALTDVLSFGLPLAFALVFLAPGWVIATLRRRVTFDRLDHHVRQVNDFLLYRWSSTRPLSEFTAVRLYIPRRSSSGDRVGTSVHVDLVGARPGKELIVYLDEDEQRARALGREIAALTSLPLRDDIDATRDQSDE